MTNNPYPSSRVVIGFLLAIWVSFIVGFAVGGRLVGDHHKEKALEGGAKGWEIDSKTGAKTFNWGR